MPCQTHVVVVVVGFLVASLLNVCGVRAAALFALIESSQGDGLTTFRKK